jgi:hypothetical protein
MTMAFDTLAARHGHRRSRDQGRPCGGGQDLQAEMKLLEQRMTIKLGAMIAAAVAIIVAAQKLF